MTLEKAATTVGDIDTIMGRAKDGPEGFDCRLQGNSVDHSQAPSLKTSVFWQLGEVRNVSTFSR
jgi:hypothetical protein